MAAGVPVLAERRGGRAEPDILPLVGVVHITGTASQRVRLITRLNVTCGVKQPGQKKTFGHH